jgi:hypothetical protein
MSDEKCKVCDMRICPSAGYAHTCGGGICHGHTELEILSSLGNARLIIAGCRNGNVDIDDISFILDELNFTPAEVVSGGSGSVDEAGERFADAVGIPKKIFVAKWGEFGRAAGPIRNKEMAEYADVLLAFWDGKSRGTKNMIDTMRKLNKPVIVEDI